MVCARPDGTEYAVVMDFGLAKERRAGAELQKLTATGIILGTPEFMSPEQLRGKSLDARTDIYSLALMTCEMLTGRLPFQGRTQQELMIARLRSDPTPLRKVRADLEFPEAVEEVLRKGLQRNPDDRYQTALEYADAFTAPRPSGFHGNPKVVTPARQTIWAVNDSDAARGRAFGIASSVIERCGSAQQFARISRHSTSPITRSRSIFPTPGRRFARRRRFGVTHACRAIRSFSILLDLTVSGVTVDGRAVRFVRAPATIAIPLPKRRASAPSIKSRSTTAALSPTA